MLFPPSRGAGHGQQGTQAKQRAVLGWWYPDRLTEDCWKSTQASGSTPQAMKAAIVSCVRRANSVGSCGTVMECRSAQPAKERGHTHTEGEGVLSAGLRKAPGRKHCLLTHDAKVHGGGRAPFAPQQVHPLPDGPKVVAKMRQARGLNPREDALAAALPLRAAAH